MISMRADADHGPSPRSRGHRGPAGATLGADFRGTEDWIFQAVGADRDVLLIGPDAIRFAGGLSRRRCRVAAVGCGSSQAVGLGWPAVAGDLDELDLAREIGDRRFDVALATELLDCAREPVALLDAVRKSLRPGGFVVATQSEPSRRGDDGADRRRPSARGTLLSLLEGAGFAVSRYRPVALPVLDPSPTGGPTGSVPIASGPWIDRSLVVALPVGNLDRGWRDPVERALAEERDAALRHASDLTRELKSASTRVESLTDRLDRSLRREEELRGLLRLSHEQIERGEEELRSLAGRFQVDLRRQSEEREASEARLNEIADHRDELESRMIRLRRSLPGRLFLGFRAIASMGRR